MNETSLPRNIEVTCECGVSFWIARGGASKCANCTRDSTPTKELPITLIVSCDRCTNIVEIIDETFEAAQIKLDARLDADGWTTTRIQNEPTGRELQPGLDTYVPLLASHACPTCTKAMK